MKITKVTFLKPQLLKYLGNDKAHTYVPVTTQPSFTLLAIHFNPATSLPAKASEIAKQNSFFPENTSGRILFLNAGFAKFMIGGSP